MSESAIPVVLCFDVEPDEIDVDRRSPRPWLGFQSAVAWVRELRPRLQEATGRPVAFAWFLRMDHQVHESYGDIAWAADAYGCELAELRGAGDAIGLHPHAWRWVDPPGGWVADHADGRWVRDSMELAFDAFLGAFGEPCRIHRFGDRFMSPLVLRVLRDRGVRVDLTVEPGARPARSIHRGMRATGRLPDYASAPRRLYRAHAEDPFRPAGGPSGDGPWMMPLTSTDARSELPAWRRLARRVLMPGRPPHRPAYLPVSWRADRFWTLLERELDAADAPYLAFALRSSVGITPGLRDPTQEKFDALISSELARRLWFTEPEQAVAHLTGDGNGAAG